jgi:uncharacterized protein
MPLFTPARSLFVLAIAAAVTYPASAATSDDSKNVFGGKLEVCSTDPMTGFERRGKCTSGLDDVGTHTVCATMTASFLDFTMRQGNDLTSPGPGFPGLKPGDRWCVCALRWGEGLHDGVVAPVLLSAIAEKSLRYLKLEDLKAHAS